MPLIPAVRAAVVRALAAGVLAVVVLGGCSAGAGTAAAPPAALVDPDRFAAAVAEPGRTTIDVHVPFAGTIPGTDRAIPYTDVGAALARGAIPADRSAPIALYCRSGVMSAEAATTLRGLGYTDVVDLRGGMNAWTAAGRPLLPTPAPLG